MLPIRLWQMAFTRITVHPNQMGGVPCVRGLRIPVATVVGLVAEGQREQQILDAYRILNWKTSTRRCDSPLRPSENPYCRPLLGCEAPD